MREAEAITREDLLARLAASRAEAKERALRLSREALEAKCATEDQIEQFFAWFEPFIDERLEAEFAKLSRLVETVHATLKMPSSVVH